MVEYFHDFKMSLGLKEIVSKNKLRYKEDGYDLDLSYISRNIIAMGFPAETLERIYRNNINEVVKFFEEKHKNHYKIYNLCSETKRRYDITKFKGMVVEQYTFQDHNPPPFPMLKEFCESLHNWLISDSKNVAAIHCKAGKGRTGLMICAYLVYTGKCIDEQGKYITINGANAALDYYGKQRTRDSKGVTIPSQKRYVHYFEYLVKHNLDYRPSTLRLTSLILTSIPMNISGAYTLICEIYRIPKQKIESFEIDIRKGQKYLLFNLPKPLIIAGDIKLEFYIKKMRKKLFQFCFNTFFIGCGYDTDTHTIMTEPCSHCLNGEKISFPTLNDMNDSHNEQMRNGFIVGDESRTSNGKSVLIKNSNDYQSVIDLSFFDLIKNKKCFDPCDCTNSLLSLSSSSSSDNHHHHHHQTQNESNNDYFSNNNNNNFINSILTLQQQQQQHPPPPPPPMTSSVSSFKSSSTSSSSNSSTQSLCNNISCTNNNCKKISNNSDMINQPINHQGKSFYLVLPKKNLDQAYKDKSNKIFSSNFKVVLKFNQDSNDSIHKSTIIPSTTSLSSSSSSSSSSTTTATITTAAVASSSSASSTIAINNDQIIFNDKICKRFNCNNNTKINNSNSNNNNGIGNNEIEIMTSEEDEEDEYDDDDDEEEDDDDESPQSDELDDVNNFRNNNNNNNTNNNNHNRKSKIIPSIRLNKSFTDLETNHNNNNNSLENKNKKGEMTYL